MVKRTNTMSMRAALIASVAVAACTTTTTTESYRRNSDAVVEAAYIAVDADFSKYRRLQAADMGIFFPATSSVPAADLDRLRRIFREAFLAELQGYEIVDESGDDVLSVEASLIDLRDASFADVPQLRREIQDVASPGTLVFLMELRDSQSGRVLGRAADSSGNPAIGRDSMDASGWAGVESAAAHWASLFRAFLDRNLDR